MAELNEEGEYQDLQEFRQASDAYQEKYGRSLLLDGVTILNSQELQQATQQNPELMQYLQGDIDQYVPVLKEIMNSFIEDLPDAVPEQNGEGLPEQEAGQPEQGLTNEQPMQ